MERAYSSGRIVRKKINNLYSARINESGHITSTEPIQGHLLTDFWQMTRGDTSHWCRFSWKPYAIHVS